MRLKADGINASVGSAATCHPLELFDNVVHIGIVDDIGACQAGHFQPFMETIDRNYSLGAEQKSAANGKLPDRSTSPDRDNIARLDVTILSGHVRSEEHTSELQS